MFFTEMWERFSFYGMRVLLILFLTAQLYPMYLSAIIPPKMGVIYNNKAYVPYKAPAFSAFQPQPGFTPEIEAVGPFAASSSPRLQQTPDIAVSWKALVGAATGIRASVKLHSEGAAGILLWRRCSHTLGNRW